MSSEVDILAALLALLDEVRGLREDLKRREHRRLSAEEGSKIPPRSSGDGLCFPNYGRAKNQPVSGAGMQDLEYYAAGCRRTLGDENKRRWWEKERILLAAIEAEVTRQGVTPAREPEPSQAPPDFGDGSDDSIPF